MIEDIKGVVRSHKSKDKQYSSQKDKQMVDKTLQKKKKVIFSNTNPNKYWDDK